MVVYLDVGESVGSTSKTAGSSGIGEDAVNVELELSTHRYIYAFRTRIKLA